LASRWLYAAFRAVSSEAAILTVMHWGAGACHASLLAKAFGVAATKAANPRFFEKFYFFENFVPQIPDN